MPQTASSNCLPTQLTIRLDRPIAVALAAKAAAEGQDAVDFATDLIARAVRDAVRDEDAARCIDARLELKRRVVVLARHLSPPDAFDPDITLKVFRAIRSDPELRGLYTTAVGGDITLRGQNTAKAVLNRELGSLIRSATHADLETVDGVHPVKVQVSGELMFSYTRLRSGSATRNTLIEDAAPR